MGGYLEMLIRQILCGCLIFSFLVPSAYGQGAYSYTAYQTVDQLVRQRNASELKQFYQTYHTLDYTDSYGQTPLCTAIRRNDYIGFRLLAQAGANRQHACVQQMSMAEKQAFDERYKSYMASLKYRSGASVAKSDTGISPVWWGVGGAVGVGAVALALAGGGGGGSSSSSSQAGQTSDDETPIPNPDPTPNPNPNPEPEPDPTPDPDPTPEPEPEPEPSPGETLVQLSPSYFETAEYQRGKFLDPINASAAYARLYTGVQDADGNITVSHNLKDVTVGMIDAGIYNTHTDLKSHVLQGRNYAYGPCNSSHKTNCWKYVDGWFQSGAAFVDANGRTGDIEWVMSQSDYNSWASQFPSNYTWNANDTTPNPNNGDITNHGTHVAGIISADVNGIGMHGVAPNAQILPVKYGFLEGLSEPISYLMDNGAKVINMSLGTASESGYDARLALTNRSQYASLLAGDMAGYKELADKKTTVFVVAAGNESAYQPSIEAGAGLYYPELSKVMMVVVAVDPDNPTQLATYSNQCGVASNYCIAAPGTNIVSTIGSGSANGGMSGTSMATPVVSGAVALLMGAYPNLTAESVTALLFETATDLGSPSKFGHGLLNLDAATKPVGQTGLATTNAVSGERIELSGSQLSVPRAMAQVMAQLPAHISVLDKYDRAFNVSTESVIQTNERDYRIFQNQLHRFMKFDSVQRIANEGSPLSFQFSTAAKKDSLTGIGAADITWQFDSSKMRVYFTEESQYGNGSFFDRITLNPFSAMEDAYGFENTYQLNPKFDVSFGFATGKNALFKTNEDQMDEAGRLMSFQGGMAYKPFKDVVLQMTGGALREEDSLLGLQGSGAFEIDSAQTYYMGLTATIKALERLTLSGSYYYGMTPPQKLNAYARTSRLYSESVAFDARWHASETDYFGLFVSSPLRVKKGTATFRLPSGRDYYSDTVYFDTATGSLASSKREWDTGVYGVYTLSPAVRLKAQSGIRFHPEHQADAKPDYQVLFGMDWRWF